MLKYKNRAVHVINGVTMIINEGIPLDGKYYFRKKEYQECFNKLRSRQYVDDYWQDTSGRFHFLFLNGSEEILTAQEIRDMAHEKEEMFK